MATLLGFAMTATFCDHIGNVIGLSAKEQMIRIDAPRIVTLVECAKAIGDWSIMQFKRKSMRHDNLITDAKPSVTVGIKSVSPKPTAVWSIFVYLLPESYFGWATAIVAVNKAKPLAPLVATTGFFGEQGRLPTSTFAVVDGRRRYWFVRIMPMNKPQGLPFAPSILSFCDCGDGRKPTTATFAITVRDFLRGIIGVHGKLPFLCQAQDVCRVAGQLLSGCYQSIIAQMGRLEKVACR